MRKELYLINKQDVPTTIYNLGILLSSDCNQEENNKDLLLPTEEYVFPMFQSRTSNDQVSTRESQNFSNKNGTVIASNEYCAIIWDHRGKLNWFLGYVMKINHNSIKIEHLTSINQWQFVLGISKLL